jgi:glycine betaine/proline transport system substrate-binding protein
MVKLSGLFTCAAMVAAIIACLGTAQGQESLPGRGKSIQPIRPAGIAANLFPVEVADIGLKKLGYDIKPVLEADYPPLHIAIAQGDADFMATEWIPVHDTFFERAGGNQTMERIGVIVPNATQGYFIDKKTADKFNINNLGQFKDPKIAKLFDSDGDGKANLTGCNAGWGCERVIEHQLDEFKLRNTVTHVQGSYFALIADMLTRYKNGESIFYYTWSPQWVDAVLKPGKDVVQLNVPYSADPSGGDTKLPDGSNPGFQSNRIVFLANRKFIEGNPSVKRLFEQIQIPIGDWNAAILRQHNGEESDAAIHTQAQEWVSAHQKEFDAWIAEAIKAKN